MKPLPLHCHKIDFDDPLALYLVFDYEFYRTAVRRMEIVWQDLLEYWRNIELRKTKYVTYLEVLCNLTIWKIGST